MLISPARAVALVGAGSIAGLKQAAKKFAQAVAKMGVNAFLLIVSMVQFGTATVKGVKNWLSKKTSAKEIASVNSGTQRSRTVIDNGLNAKKWAGKKVEELPETAVKGSKTNIDTVVRIESFTPPGSSKPIEIYTDGFSRVPKGKIDIYVRGHVKKPVNYDIRKEIIKQFEKMQNENPEKITKQMQRENAAWKREIHNYERALGNGSSLEKDGIPDTPENNEMIAKVLLSFYKRFSASES